MVLNRKKKGMVGIDTAIILIAFVLVAAAVAFVVLDMGMTSATKAKQTMVNGLQQASTALEVNGEILGLTNSTGTGVDELAIPLGVTPGTGYVSFDTATFVVSFSDQYGSYPNIYIGVSKKSISASTSLYSLHNNSSNGPIAKAYFLTGNVTPTVLGPYGQALLVISLPNGKSLTAYNSFTVTIKPSVGGALTVSRIIPPDTPENTTIDLG
ncbi:archaellin/type IV pilin N-terminal domain-containing protein [Caldisphaera sp.]|uniref:archaellin/type IV pilin N-terminal domain-containing protein n=1 Tax=Caldisphaera sp. TaxID=2060322 RepID=UPI0025C3A7B1|nr:archaellin/type IV pilin N-terminal domain-containing protein [Caldisphaera sp.]